MNEINFSGEEEQSQRNITIPTYVVHAGAGGEHVQKIDNILMVEMKQHSNFSVSSLGMYGGLERTPQLFNGHAETIHFVIS